MLVDAVTTLFGFSRSSRALVGALVITALAACSDGSHKATTSSSSPPPVAVSKNVRPLTLGPIDVQSAGPVVKIDKTIRKTVLAATERYLDTAVYRPLDAGEIGPGYRALFDAGLRAAATGRDQSALTDLTVGKATSYSARSKPVRVAALIDVWGAVLYVATTLSTTLKVTTASGPLTIARNVELTFAASAKRWLITAYRVTAKRSTPTATTTTSATSGTTP
jgi:hypothetical protein